MSTLNRRQRIALCSGAALLALMWLIPPWRCALWLKLDAKFIPAVVGYHWFQYAWVFAPPRHDPSESYAFTTHLLWNRLWGQTAAVLLVTWITMRLLGRRRDSLAETGSAGDRPRIRHSPRFLIGITLIHAALSCVAGWTLIQCVFLFGAIGIQYASIFTLGDCMFLPVALPLWRAGLAQGPILTAIPLLLNSLLWAAVVWYLFQLIEV